MSDGVDEAGWDVEPGDEIEPAPNESTLLQFNLPLRIAPAGYGVPVAGLTAPSWCVARM